jgi:GNAT superfamily N-acetyltransferase
VIVLPWGEWPLQREPTQAGDTILYRVGPDVSNEELNALFAVSWPDHGWTDLQPVLQHSLTFVCAYHDSCLIGFVNVAWDGGIHAFLLDTTVHPDWRRQGIGRQLVRRAAAVARERGMQWLHVDYEPYLDAFYRGCGFEPTVAGLMRLNR